MRRVTLFVFSLCLCLTGGARSVSMLKAESVANDFFGINPSTKGGDVLRLIWTGDPKTKSGEEVDNPPFYIYGKDGGGFVIVAGDDCLRPILGYSFESNFVLRDMPDNIIWWFSSLTEMVNQVRKEGHPQSNEVSSEWRSVSAKGSSGVELHTARWNQSHPYNMFTPMLRSNGKEHCNTGCTNTATAIVMRYHKYPEAGKGTLPDYTYSKGGTIRTQPGHELGHKYDWDIMPLSNLNSSTPLNQAMQVAQLMYDCGVMNKCKWNPNNADTDPQNIPNALITYMGYDKGIRYLEREGFDTGKWEEMIREELDNGRPVLYGGGRTDGNGHEWVIDGYNDSGYFMMNWGWGGSSNGFYLISPLNEAGMAFTERHDMIIGIKPNVGGEPYGNGVPCLTGSSTSNWRFNLNRSFTTIFNIRNQGVLSNRINYRVALIDKDGNLKHFLSNSEVIEIEGFQIVTLESTCIMESMPNINDLIVLFYEVNGVWRPMEYTDMNVIKMKGTSAIEECTTVSYSKKTHILTINTEKDNAIQIYYTDSGGNSFIRMSQQNSGTNSINTATVPTNVGNGYSPYDFTVHIFNLAESKEIRLKLKTKDDNSVEIIY
ncbi:MAG: C10 family peptidase [Bacteroidales bacterium]|nr:C10 family peptidase [Bacteroidales bacterium]